MHARTTAAAALLAAAGAANAQLVINEVFENPVNGGDDTWEFIEIYGPPDFDLTGFAVAAVKGGFDTDGDGVPDATEGSKPEIDEAFTLDGWRTDEQGLFVLYITSGFGFTGLAPYLGPQLPGYNPAQPESPINPRYAGAARFTSAFIPSVFDPPETASNLSNDGSSTYVLVRRRPNHAVSPAGQSVYLPGYAWAKDTSPDIDFDSRLDVGDEHTLGVPVYYSEGSEGAQTTAVQLRPVQIVDEIAWSNDGGKEYHTPGRGGAQNRISDTPGFNADVVSRVRYIPGAPALGNRVDSDGDVVLTNAADESWIYGEQRDWRSAFGTDDLQAGESGYDEYQNYLDGDGLRRAVTEVIYRDPVTRRFVRLPFERGDTPPAGQFGSDWFMERTWGAPTDPSGLSYAEQSLAGIDPDEPPFFRAAPDPAGTLRFDDYDIGGFRFTPGSFNDAPEASRLAGTALAAQFRFLRGDFDFDGDVDCDDRSMISAAAEAGWTLDDREPAVDDRGTPEASDDFAYDAYTRQLAGFNATLTMIRMDLSDGSTGEWTSGQVMEDGRIIAWGGAVTEADLAAFGAEFPGLTCDPADRDGDGDADVQDLLAYLRSFRAKDADMDGDGDTDVQDLLAYLRAFRAA